jgi:hypothetical protein
MNPVLYKFAPRIARKHLLLVACCAWLIAGSLLLWRSFVYFHLSHFWPVKLSLAVAGGLLFFRAMFLRISTKHINRIKSMTVERPCFFSFFNLKSYMLMAVMITGGVMLRSSHVVNDEYLSLFYIFMSTPLLFSSLRFLQAWCLDKV